MPRKLPRSAQHATPAKVSEPASPVLSPGTDANTHYTAAQKHILHLQRTHGNQATRSRIQRYFPSYDLGGMDRDLTTAEIQAELDAGRGTDFAYTMSFRNATPEQKDRIIESFLGDWDGLGTKAKLASQMIWNSYGEDLFTAPPKRAALFKGCIEGGMHIPNIKAMQKIKPILEGDVRQIAKLYTQKNREFVEKELRQLQGFVPESASAAAGAEKNRIDAVRQLAREVKRAEEYKAKLRKIPVGYKSPWLNYVPSVAAYNYITGDPGLVDVPFDPEAKPEIEQQGDQYPAKANSWGQVKELYDFCELLIANIAGKSPVVYRAHAEGDLDKLIDSPPQEANKEAIGMLLDTYLNILTLQGKLDSAEALDMIPILNQLMKGEQKGASGTAWSSPFYSAAAQGLMEQHKLEDLVKSLGLAAVGMVAFIVAEIATGGLATLALVGGIGISGYQAIDSLTKASTTVSLADSAVSEETRIMTQGQATSAMISAGLDTVGFFLDGVGAVFTASKLINTARVGFAVDMAAGARTLQLKTLDLLDKPTQLSVVRGAINEHGVEKAAKLAGFSHAEELLPYAAADPDLLARIRGFVDNVDEMAAASVSFKGSVQEGLAKVVAGEITDPKTVESLVMNGINSLGAPKTIRDAGGWDKLKAILPENSPAGQQLFDWRESVRIDLENYVTTQLYGEIKNTGTYKSFKNDLDMSLLGENASANRDKVLLFLEQRTGFSPKELNKNMLIDVFTDPNRAHLYDQLDEAARATVANRAVQKERDLIFNKMLLDAQKEGSGAVARVERQMAELGIKKIDNFKVLSKEERQHMAMVVDGLHNEFAKTTDIAKKQELAEKIAEYQSQINLAEGGGYSSGGGVLEWVTKRDKLGTLEGGAVKEMIPAQAFGNLIDQFAKLEHAMQVLANAKTAEQAAAALRDVGKYAFRYAAGRPLTFTSHADEAEKLADAFKHIWAGAQAKGIKEGVDAGADLIPLLKRAEKLIEWVESDTMMAINFASKEAGITSSVDMGLVMDAIRAQTRVVGLKKAVNQAMQALGIAMDVSGGAVGYQSGRNDK
jgi:hypothetical protein